jgi:hypothetical protein
MVLKYYCIFLFSGQKILHFRRLRPSKENVLFICLTVTNVWKLQVEISSVKEHLVSSGVETRFL